MSNLPDKTPQRSLVRRAGVGPTMLAVGLALFVLTRVINWLPLGLIDGVINAVIWPVILVCVLGGGFLTWRRLSAGI